MMIAGTEHRRQGCSLQDGKQWGTNTIGSRTTRTEAYPLPYSEFCLPIVSGKGYVGGLNYGFGVGVTNFGLTSVTIANNSEDSSYRWTGYTYIVVGAQPQWGYGNSESTQTFPIKFTNSVIGIYGSKRAINYEYTFAATSITNTNFFMSTRNSEGSSRVIACNWLAIGQQQTK